MGHDELSNALFAVSDRDAAAMDDDNIVSQIYVTKFAALTTDLNKLRAICYGVQKAE
jgi:hypothetical protein